MEIRDWLLTISMIGHFSYTLWTYIERRGDKTGQQISALTDRVAELDADVALMKAATESAPTHTDLAGVHEKVNQTNAMVNQLVGENRSQTDLLRIIVGKLMDK